MNRNILSEKQVQELNELSNSGDVKYSQRVTLITLSRVQECHHIDNELRSELLTIAIQYQSLLVTLLGYANKSVNILLETGGEH